MPIECVYIHFKTTHLMAYKTSLSPWTSELVSQSAIMLTRYAYSNVSNLVASALVSKMIDRGTPTELNSGPFCHKICLAFIADMIRYNIKSQKCQCAKTQCFMLYFQSSCQRKGGFQWFVCFVVCFFHSRVLRFQIGCNNVKEF